MNKDRLELKSEISWPHKDQKMDLIAIFFMVSFQEIRQVFVFLVTIAGH